MPEWEPTGRSFGGPAARWVEVARQGELYTALVVDSELRNPRAFDPMVVALGFLEAPSIEGLAPLTLLVRQQGRLVYRTGPLWPLGQVLPAVAATIGPSPRAACELAALVAPILEAAARSGREVGLTSHGGLTPWRLGLDDDGEVLVLGYGLPQLELSEVDRKPDAASWRYCPPERVLGEPEALASDLFALSLMVAELATGGPIYQGDAEAVRLAAQRGRAHKVVHTQRGELDAGVCDALERGLRVHPDARWPSGRAMAEAFGDLADSPVTGGPDLAELMAWVRTHVPEGPRVIPAQTTETRRVARAVAPEPEAPRWARVQRARAPTATRVPPDHNAMYPHDPQGPDTVRMRVRHGGALHWAKLDRAETLAKSTARLVDRLEVSPVDLTGRIRGWYRVAQGEAAWYGDEPTSVLDPERELELDFVENRVIRALLEVEGEDDEPFPVEVGTAVHAQFLVGELRRLLELSGTWRLQAEGDPMDPWQILDDWEPQHGLRLRLCRVRRGRR